MMKENSRLRWFGHVEQKDDNDWVKPFDPVIIIFLFNMSKPSQPAVFPVCKKKTLGVDDRREGGGAAGTNM